jgi:membrane protease YdiL (CAAX protease family)
MAVEQGTDQGQWISGEPTRSFSGLAVVAWGLIAAAAVGFLIAGDVRTGWIVGDLEPIGDEVALPRLATLALMLGLLVLAIHQIRRRRTMPLERYRGPSVLALLALSVGLSVALCLPMASTINGTLSLGISNPIPILVWQSSSQLAVLIVAWLAVFRPDALANFHPFRDLQPMRHAAMGVVAGVGSLLLTFVLASVMALAFTGKLPSWNGDVPITLVPPEFPPILVFVITVGFTPVAEELFFRGAVLHAWQREYGLWPAVIGSSVLFGLVHFGLRPIEALPAALPALALLGLSGLIFALLAVRTGSLVAPMAAHATNNVVPLVLIFLTSVRA